MVDPAYQLGRLEEMTRGWFVGDFQPTMLATEDVEVAIRHHPAGSAEASHFHKIATEITVILKGEARMLDRVFREGDIIKLLPGTTTSFEAISDVTTVVVKFPGAKNDKYLAQ